MQKTLITDDEILYRRIPHDKSFLVVQDGKLRVSSQAFSDRAFRPSVDRAKLRENDPRHSQLKPSDAVVSLVTRDVRSIDTIVKVSHDGQPQTFSIDVEHVPIFNDPLAPDNPAHAEIYTRPDCDKNAFRKLKERLAQLANERLWDIEPPPLLS
jgi:hypothetical protein